MNPLDWVKTHQKVTGLSIISSFCATIIVDSLWGHGKYNTIILWVGIFTIMVFADIVIEWWYEEDWSG